MRNAVGTWRRVRSIIGGSAPHSARNGGAVYRCARDKSRRRQTAQSRELGEHPAELRSEASTAWRRQRRSGGGGGGGEAEAGKLFIERNSRARGDTDGAVLYGW